MSTPKQHTTTLRALELPALIAVPLVLIVAAYTQVSQAALLTALACALCLLVFFASFEAGRPQLNQLMPTVVLAAVAVAGRILFAPFPDVKPVSAITIIAGAVFGRRSGFMVGALAALISNFFFGQGAWTPWQMYGWGLMGYLAGVLQEKGAFEHQTILYAYGFLAPIIEYGLLLDLWTVVGFVRPLTLELVLATFAAGFAFNLTHGVATVAFLVLLYAPWRKKLMRIKRKYGLA